jgi:hypothetical protein
LCSYVSQSFATAFISIRELDPDSAGIAPIVIGYFFCVVWAILETVKDPCKLAQRIQMSQPGFNLSAFNELGFELSTMSSQLRWASLQPLRTCLIFFISRRPGYLFETVTIATLQLKKPTHFLRFASSLEEPETEELTEMTRRLIKPKDRVFSSLLYLAMSLKYVLVPKPSQLEYDGKIPEGDPLFSTHWSAIYDADYVSKNKFTVCTKII